MRIDATSQRVVADGRFVTADILDDSGRVLSRRRRMVFVRGTAPERAVRGLGRGSRLHVYGIPRIDLSAIWQRLREGRREPAPLDRPLPYEIVIVGVYPR